MKSLDKTISYDNSQQTWRTMGVDVEGPEIRPKRQSSKISTYHGISISSRVVFLLKRSILFQHSLNVTSCDLKCCVSVVFSTPLHDRTMGRILHHVITNTPANPKFTFKFLNIKMPPKTVITRLLQHIAQFSRSFLRHRLKQWSNFQRFSWSFIC